MNTEDLRAFIDVVEAGGVAPGARRMGVPKSIVSRRLTRLEQVIGAQLLSRTTRGSKLTEAGAIFLKHALNVVAELDAAQDSISPDGEVRGLIRIAAPLSFGISQLAPVFAELANRHPLLQVDVAYSDRHVDLGKEGFDCAVRLGFLPDSSLVARRICVIRGLLVASPTYLAAQGTPLTLDELGSHRAVAKKGEVWPIMDEGELVRIYPRGRFTADNGEAILAATLAGLGVAALPQFLVESHIADGRLVKLLPNYEIPEAGMYVVRMRSAFSSRKISVLIDILNERFGPFSAS